MSKSSEIIKHLRAAEKNASMGFGGAWESIYGQAASHIEALEAECARLRNAVAVERHEIAKEAEWMSDQFSVMASEKRRHKLFFARLSENFGNFAISIRSRQALSQAKG